MSAAFDGSSRPLTCTTSMRPGSSLCARAGPAAASTTKTANRPSRIARMPSPTMQPMEVADFCSTSHVVIVAGKGGVGKTTVTAALAVAASRAGRSALIGEGGGKSGLPAIVAADATGYEQVDFDERERTRFLTPDAALVDHLVSHGMKRISKRLVASGALEVVATAVPGMKDILVLGKVKSLEES